MKHIYATLLSTALALPAYADTAQWSQSMQRGMKTYSIQGEGGAIIVTCDPDRVFGPSSNATINVQLSGDNTATAFVVLSATGEQAAFTLKDGMVFEFEADPQEWEDFVGFLRAGGPLAFVTANANLRLDDIQPLTDIDC